MQPVTYEQVYYVYADESTIQLNPIAIRPSIYKNRIEWEDTGRGKFINAADIKYESSTKVDEKHPPEKIIIFTEDGNVIVLNALNLDTYYAKLKDGVAGHPDFETEQALKDYYLHTNFEAY